MTVFSPRPDGTVPQKAYCGRSQGSFRFRSKTCLRIGTAGTAHDSSEPFNMAYLAIRGCGAVNGVQPVARPGRAAATFSDAVSEVAGGRSAGDVRDEWREHMPTWDSARGGSPLGGFLREGPLARNDGMPRSRIFAAPATPIYGNFRPMPVRLSLRYVRKRHARQLGGAGVRLRTTFAQAAQALDANSLTLGFARRFAALQNAQTSFCVILNGSRRILTEPGRAPSNSFSLGKPTPRTWRGKT